jgi:hypothetical protein
MTEKINDLNVHLKFVDCDGEYHFCSICDVVCFGVPSNDDGQDMKRADDLLYVWREDKWVALS